MTSVTGTTPIARPFAPGSVSLRLYPHNDLEAREIVRELCGQARLALTEGFDGIMLSEHHGGFAGYLSNPLQFSAFVLDETESGWVAPCPLILPLRPVVQLAEEMAWLGARHPGRVGLGVAAGSLPLDFEAMGLPPSDAVPLFKERLPHIVAMLEGRELGPVSGDPALQACARTPIPVLSAAVSVAAARRAATCGAGILSEGMSPVPRVRTLFEAFETAGGSRPKVLIRRVWIGERRADLIERQRAVYDSYTTQTFGAEDATVVARAPDEMSEQLSEIWQASGADALNLRVHLPGIGPSEVRRQIKLLATRVIPRIRRSLSAEPDVDFRPGVNKIHGQNS